MYNITFDDNSIIFRNNAANVEKNKLICQDGAIYAHDALPWSGNGVTYIMPDIAHINVIENGGEKKVVIVTFVDGTEEKAVLSNEDTFNLETGISICLTKKLLSFKQGDAGSTLYNKLIKHALKIYENQIKEKDKKEKEEKELSEKLERITKKRAAKKERREAKKREYLINIQKEAYIRAMREIDKH